MKPSTIQERLEATRPQKNARVHKAVTVRLSSDQHRRIMEAARKEKTSMNTLFIAAIEQAIDDLRLGATP